MVTAICSVASVCGRVRRGKGQGTCVNSVTIREPSLNAADDALDDALALTVLSELLKFTFTMQVNILVLLLFYDSASVSSSTI